MGRSAHWQRKSLQAEQRTSQIVANWSVLYGHAKVSELLNAKKDWNIALTQDIYRSPLAFENRLDEGSKEKSILDDL